MDVLIFRCCAHCVPDESGQCWATEVGHGAYCTTCQKPSDFVIYRPVICDCPTSGLGYRHHRMPCPRAGENEPISRPGEESSQ